MVRYYKNIIIKLNLKITELNKQFFMLYISKTKKTHPNDKISSQGILNLFNSF